MKVEYFERFASLVLALSAATAQAQLSNPIIQKTIAAIDADGLNSLKTDLDQQCLIAVQRPKDLQFAAGSNPVGLP